MKSALVMHPDCGRHDTGWGHPEHMGRLPAIVRAIEKQTPALHELVLHHVPEHATDEQIDRVHASGHIERVRSLVAEAEKGGQPIAASPDTMVSATSWDAAMAAAGCAVEAVGVVMRGEAGSAFALTRPPGHHAEADEIMGFCLFNNVAVATRALQVEWDVGRVMIVDWDVHHGNGTQHIFQEDPTVYYLSLHQSPWYPGTGEERERGTGPGDGTVRNVPIAAGTSRKAYLSLFEEALDAAFAEFAPDFVLISAGYDCLAGDPFGGLLLEPEDLHAMTRGVLQRARSDVEGRLAVVLEGGYDPARTGAGVVATLRALCDLPPVDA